jgi:DNA-binding NarL/FixJ family response regulator
MRTELHLSSLIESTRNLGRPSITRQDLRKLPSHPAADAGQVNDSGFVDGSPTRLRPPNATGNRAAVAGNGRTDTKEDEFPGLRHSRENDDDGPRSRESKRQSIVIVHSRTVFRDCLAQCLEMAYVDHDVFSFASIAEWLRCKEPNARDAAVIIIVIDAVSESSAADLLSLETNAVTNPVVIVSDTNDLNHIIRVLKSGVRGYIPTSLSFNVAVEAVRLVKAGGVFIPASSIVPNGDEPIQPKNSTLLTQRQMEVVEEIRNGKANKQIAYELNMSEHTVKVHLRHIMRKLKARNRTEVAVLSGSLLTNGRDVPRAELSVRPKDSTVDEPGA